jgi:hypothetical protein
VGYEIFPAGDADLGAILTRPSLPRRDAAFTKRLQHSDIRALLSLFKGGPIGLQLRTSTSIAFLKI